ncbi:hypothetical protein CUMW_257580 [Citrus unshiu]|uniref:Uncharacterized protein n=1 Tax=Citrus unshiu TaxID=55188 RepID=A0A2H5QSI0_CITUN|nr:hypothetical protein CUMW_257580 [Citrus unshiu]
MEEDKQSGVVDRKRQTRQKNGGSTKQTINKTSPEYIRTHSVEVDSEATPLMILTDRSNC